MIDASKSPMPAWRRYLTAVFLTVLIAAAGYVVWVKELHPSSPATSSPPAAAAPAAGAPTGQPEHATPSTTIPGGIPVSSRDLFGN